MDHPAEPQFWEQRYVAGTIPWDLGGVPPRLTEFLATQPRDLRVLIPGCGSGHEVAVFHHAGHQVTAIDFAPAAVAHARTTLGPELGAHVVLGDFFAHPLTEASFDLIYERTFFCAIPPRLRAAYIQRMTQLLKPDGALLGLFFLGDERDGPPYQLNTSDHEALFAPRFLLANDEPVAQPFPLFGAKERWREYRLKR